VIVPDSLDTRTKAAAAIQRGGVIAFRTDTFYGLGADPFNRAALQTIRTLKGREDNKPILLLIADLKDVDRFIAQRSELFDHFAEEFWPGPLTLIGKARDELPAELTADTGTIGVRLPDDSSVCELLRVCGGALTATSANVSGQSEARTASEVSAYFPSGVDLIVNSGEVTATQPSSVLDLSGPEPVFIREGRITRAALLPSR
jgi:L-threonylcarbamoyladenylate synthase